MTDTVFAHQEFQELERLTAHEHDLREELLRVRERLAEIVAELLPAGAREADIRAVIGAAVAPVGFSSPSGVALS